MGAEVSLHYRNRELPSELRQVATPGDIRLLVSRAKRRRENPTESVAKQYFLTYKAAEELIGSVIEDVS